MRRGSATRRIGFTAGYRGGLVDGALNMLTNVRSGRPDARERRAAFRLPATRSAAGSCRSTNTTLFATLRRASPTRPSRVRRSAPGVESSATVLEGHPAARLLEHAAGADLVVVGRRGLGGFKRLVLGSVSDHLVRHATCAVLVVHEKDRSARRAATALRLLRGLLRLPASSSARRPP
jgi:hypothetical protein